MLQKRERLAKNRQARNELGQRVTSRRLSLTGRVLPGDKTAEVKAGPPVKYFGFARVSEQIVGGGVLPTWSGVGGPGEPRLLRSVRFVRRKG